MPQILAPDVLILGGGIQGLCLLHYLRALPGAERSIVLLEPIRLGAGQTRHSQAYLHVGLQYRSNEAWRPDFLNAKPLWDNLLRGARPPSVMKDGWLGCEDRYEFVERYEFWRSQGVKCVKMKELPPVLAGSSVRLAAKTAERSLDVEWFLGRLRNSYDDSISAASDLRVQMEPSQQPCVEAKLGNEQVQFLPQLLICAAGEANESLAKGVGLNDLRQDSRAGNLLVAHGHEDILPACNGYFPDMADAFLVTKPGESHRNYWLFASNDSFKAPDLASWIPEAVRTFARLVPSAFARRSDLQWCAYRENLVRGPAGSDHNVAGGKILSHGKIWFAWPNRLTLAPLVAQELAGRVADEMWAPNASWSDSEWKQLRVRAEAPRTLWRDLPQVTWSEFAKTYRLTEI